MGEGARGRAARRVRCAVRGPVFGLDRALFGFVFGAGGRCGWVLARGGFGSFVNFRVTRVGVARGAAGGFRRGGVFARGTFGSFLHFGLAGLAEFAEAGPGAGPFALEAHFETVEQGHHVGTANL